MTLDYVRVVADASNEHCLCQFIWHWLVAVRQATLSPSCWPCLSPRSLSWCLLVLVVVAAFDDCDERHWHQMNQNATPNYRDCHFRQRLPLTHRSSSVKRSGKVGVRNVNKCLEAPSKCVSPPLWVNSLWLWHLTSDLENIFSSVHSHDEYFWQVSFRSVH